MGRWNLVVFSPAYNVARQAPELSRRMASAARLLARRGIALKAWVVVDDGSTDRTWAVLSAMCKKYPFLRPIRKEKNTGPVPALLQAMAAARRIGLPNSSAIFVRMDTDLEHQPEDIVKLIAPILSGKSAVSAGCIPFDARSGRELAAFNRRIGLEGSRRFLGVSLPQFAPGFIASKGGLFSAIAPKLPALSKKFRRAYGMDMATVDFVFLALARRKGGRPAVVRLRKIEGRWLKRQHAPKIGRYLAVHKATMEFLEKLA